MGSEWLAGRHQHVAVLLTGSRVVKVEDGSPWVDVDALVQAFDDLDASAGVEGLPGQAP